MIKYNWLNTLLTEFKMHNYLSLHQAVQLVAKPQLKWSDKQDKTSNM